MSNLIGYARVSSIGQSYESQVETLAAQGCVKIFREKMSGADDSRPELKRCLEQLGPGDTLIVTKLDRVARSLTHLLRIVEELKGRHIGFRCVYDAIDTTTPMGIFFLQIMGSVAELERSMIAERTARGREVARKKGIRMGRKSRFTDADGREMYMMRKSGATYAEIGGAFNCRHTTVSRLLARIGMDEA